MVFTAHPHAVTTLESLHLICVPFASVGASLKVPHNGQRSKSTAAISVALLVSGAPSASGVPVCTCSAPGISHCTCIAVSTSRKCHRFDRRKAQRPLTPITWVVVYMCTYTSFLAQFENANIHSFCFTAAVGTILSIPTTYYRYERCTTSITPPSTTTFAASTHPRPVPLASSSRTIPTSTS